MIIEHIEMSGFNLQKVNSDYSFEPGLNLIVGETASGKTTILNSIVRCFSYNSSYEGRSILDFHQNHQEKFPNQEPSISIQFQYQEATYRINKTIKMNEVECEMYSLNREGEISFLCGGTEAIERLEHYSKDIIFLRNEQDLINHFFEFNLDEQLIPEYLLVLNRLLNQYSPFGQWLDGQVTINNGEIGIISRDGNQIQLAAGGEAFLAIISLIAILRTMDNHQLLILDEFWASSLDYSHIESVYKCLSEVLDCQVIMTSNPMRASKIHTGHHLIHLD